ncbi:glycosyltransferase [Phyllobacterium salinisoli]|uniref:Glycosyltransferase n=1 Tax=Phyllobacterium salinisoli TaxID=1899321 RepID=A0A368K5M1_9HYPH|nr:glycosyltransferase family 2 protein [Phyllobacterium salinisoli]RCS24688.1 glycosyltransferase [Phyllobacterium salinisoli]
MSTIQGFEELRTVETSRQPKEYRAEILVCSAIAARLCLKGARRNAILQAFTEATRNNTSFTDEVMISAKVGQDQLYKAIADELGLKFEDRIVSSRILLREEDVPQNLRAIRHALVAHGDGRTVLFIAPTISDLIVLKRCLSQSPALALRLRICPPSMLAEMMRLRQERGLAQRVQEMTPPHFSAARVLHSWQAFMLAETVFLLFGSFLFHPSQTAAILHISLTLLFLSCGIIRLLASLTARTPRLLPTRGAPPKDMPVYTILVPLYKEAEIVEQLLDALSRLRWPASKLDIKLVCEADDAATIAAIEIHALPPCFEIIKVPRTGPRTKPKALNYALQFARGEFLVVYDAEDRPHPDQLVEAWDAFCVGGENLACLQAPLLISNVGSNWLARMFAFEYAVLFRGLLPWLAGKDLVMPLGGTSNHLRRKCLEIVGGWDGHNVTEDADLGIRLARFGYRIGVITRGTWEDAPEDYGEWKKQRTRWLKGWMQTWLVHMRDPLRTCRELGAARSAISLIYMTGLILSALIYPFMILTFLLLFMVFIGGQSSFWSLYLLCIDSMNILLAYFSYYVLGLKTLTRDERKAGRYFCWIPVYWLLMSISAWRAVWQLFQAPHLWEKTPHRPTAGFARRQPDGAQPQAMQTSGDNSGAGGQKRRSGADNAVVFAADRLKVAALIG